MGIADSWLVIVPGWLVGSRHGKQAVLCRGDFYENPSGTACRNGEVKGLAAEIGN